MHDQIALRSCGAIAWAIRKDSPQLEAFDPNVWFHDVEYVAADKLGA